MPNGTTVEIKYIKISPTKLRRVANLIRGQAVGVADSIVRSLPHRGAEVIRKVLKSAISNAKNNHSLDPDDLYVSEIFINEAARIKRFQPRARGRVYPILKRMSHINMTLLVRGGKK